MIIKVELVEVDSLDQVSDRLGLEARQIWVAESPVTGKLQVVITGNCHWHICYRF